MAPVNPPTYIQNASYQARHDRLHTGALLMPEDSTHLLASRSGVRPSNSSYHGMQVIARPTPDMWVRVRAGTVFIRAASVTGGVAVAHNDADYDLQIAAAHATLPRIDLVVARLYDAADDSGTSSEWRLEVVTGTPAVSPTVPAVTYDGAVPLAQVAVAAGATAIVGGNITDLRRWTVGLGGILPTNANPSAFYPGMAIYRTDENKLRVRNNSRWLEVFTDDYAFPYGLLGTVNVFSTQVLNPGLVADPAASSASKVPGSDLTFTVPPNVPSSRRLRVTLTFRASFTGNTFGTSVFMQAGVWLDNASWMTGRTVAWSPGVVSPWVSRVEFMSVPSAGSHTAHVRLWASLVNNPPPETVPEVTWHGGSLGIELV